MRSESNIGNTIQFWAAIKRSRNNDPNVVRITFTWSRLFLTFCFPLHLVFLVPYPKKTKSNSRRWFRKHLSVRASVLQKTKIKRAPVVSKIHLRSSISVAFCPCFIPKQMAVVSIVDNFYRRYSIFIPAPNADVFDTPSLSPASIQLSFGKYAHTHLNLSQATASHVLFSYPFLFLSPRDHLSQWVGHCSLFYPLQESLAPTDTFWDHYPT